MAIIGWIFGILLVLVTVVGIVYGTIKDWYSQDGDTDKNVVETLVAFGIPLGGIIVTGLLIGLTGNVFCRMIFALITLIYGVYAISRLFKVKIYVQSKELPSTIVGAVYAVFVVMALSSHLTKALQSLSLMTLGMMLLSAVAVWFSLGYAKDKKTVLLMLSLLISLSVTGVTVKRVWNETAKNPQERLEISTDGAKEAVKEVKEEFGKDDDEQQTKETKAETETETDTPEPTEAPWDGIIDSNEELEEKTNFPELAKAMGVERYDYLNHTEDGRVFVWSNGKILCYDGAESITIAAERCQKQVEVIGNNYFIKGTDSVLYKNGEPVAKNVGKFKATADGTIEYKSQGKEYTLE